jgi:hypothetical protein
MKPMKILYLGDDNPLFTSAHRAAALRRLGHEVTVINPRAALPQSRLVGGIGTRVGLWPFAPWVNAMLRRRINGAKFDLAWIDCGADLSPGFHAWLRRRGIRIVNYNVDDPFGTRDGRKWDLYRRSVRQHDLTVVVRNENVAEAGAAGARKPLRVFRSYDPVAHAPLKLSDEEHRHWASEVVFVGSWMPERGPLMVRLLELGVPLSIRGNHWQLAPEWERLRSVIQGPAVHGPDYVKAIQCAKIALGLLSKGNRDLHTTRSAEVPFIGGAVFCAERTSEHEQLLRDGIEAVFWTTPEECAVECAGLLADEPRRTHMAAAAQQRLTDWRLSNDEVMAAVLRVLAGQAPDHQLVA